MTNHESGNTEYFRNTAVSLPWWQRASFVLVPIAGLWLAVCWAL